MITGIQIRSMGDGPVLVDAEINGQWVTVIREIYCDGGIISHTVEPLGMRYAAECAAERENQRDQTAYDFPGGGPA